MRHLAARAADALVIEAVRQALRGERAWLVGGAVRDRMLGRDVRPDLDVALDGDVRAAAKAVAKAIGGARFELSDAFGAWRVVGEEGQVDLVALQGGSLEADLAARDLTVNAMAEPLAGGPLVDPHGGRDDLRRRVLRMVSPTAFDADPLRVVRVARLATELGFAADPPTLAAARERAPQLREVAGERVWAELRRLVDAPAAVQGWALLADVGAEAVLVPELHAARGVEQSVYHHKDVHGHVLETLGVAVAMRERPGELLRAPDLDEAVRRHLAQPLADDLDRGGALRWAALLHDVAKPVTQQRWGDRVGFPGHDHVGADDARGVLARLRASQRLRGYVADLTRHHLRTGFLVHAPLGPRVVHRELRETAPHAADVVLLTCCDRLATRGRKADEAIARHLEVASLLLRAAFAWPEWTAQPPLVRGDELAAALGRTPGPGLGELLTAIDEARYAGEVSTAEEAVALARTLG